MQLYLVVALVFALLVAVFAVQNATTVMVSFLVWKLEISLVLVILGSAVAGALFVFLLGMVRQFGLQLKLHNFQQRVRDLEKTLEEIKKEQEKPQVTAEKQAVENHQSPG